MKTRIASELEIALMRKMRAEGKTILEICRATGRADTTVLTHVGDIPFHGTQQRLPKGPELLALIRNGKTVEDLMWDYYVGKEAVRNAVKKAMRAEEAARKRA